MKEAILKRIFKDSMKCIISPNHGVKHKFYCIITLFLTFQASAQLDVQNQVLASGGSSYNSSVLMLDYTFGEPFTSTFAGSSFPALTQGFQQPRRVKVFQPQFSVGIDEFAENSFEIYPNPFTNELFIKILTKDIVGVALYDASGRLVCTQTINSIETKLYLSQLAPGTYRLVISASDGQVENYPIIKI
jgi:hypothetical protein